MAVDVYHATREGRGWAGMCLHKNFQRAMRWEPKMLEFASTRFQAGGAEGLLRDCAAPHGVEQCPKFHEHTHTHTHKISSYVHRATARSLW